jgi:arylformamidase
MTTRPGPARFIDVSWPLGPEMPCYPGDPALEVALVASHERDGFAVRSLALGTHSGTHVDAPAHVVPEGWCVDEIPLDWLCGPARVVDARGAGRQIDARFVSSLSLERVERLLLRTVSEELPRDRFDPGHAIVTEEAALLLRAAGSLRLLGFDYLTMEAEDDPRLPVHHALLGAEPPIVLLEAIDLRGVAPGDYQLWCLPLRLEGADGAPARAMLERRPGRSRFFEPR